MTQDQRDAYMLDAQRIIDEFGWMVQAVFGTDEPGYFAYTVGLTASDKPELFIDGLPPEQATAVLNAVTQCYLDGTIDPSRGESFEAGLLVPLRWRGPVLMEQAEAFMAEAMYPDKVVTVMQVIWPDDQGHYPGEPGYNDTVFPQRLIEVDL